ALLAEGPEAELGEVVEPSVQLTDATDAQGLGQRAECVSHDGARQAAVDTVGEVVHAPSIPAAGPRAAAPHGRGRGRHPGGRAGAWQVRATDCPCRRGPR